MGDEQSMNAIPTGVWVRRELVDALREALNEYPDATLYPTPEAFNVALMDTFKRAAQAARAVVDAVETEDKPKVPTTDLPDAVTAWTEFRREHYIAPNIDGPALESAFIQGHRTAVAALTTRAKHLADEWEPHPDGDIQMFVAQLLGEQR